MEMRDSDAHNIGQRLLVGGLTLGVIGIGLICFSGGNFSVVSEFGASAVLIGSLTWLYGALKLGQDIDKGRFRFWKLHTE